VVKILIGLNIGFFVLSYLLPWFLPIEVSAGRDFLGLLPAPSNIALNLLGWADIRLVMSGHWWVLITAIFLHGGLLHIVFNMLWIRDLAPQTEMIFGSQGLVSIFILSGIAGNLVAIFSPYVLNLILGLRLPFMPVIGASGAVFGLMGAMIAFGRKRGGIFGRQLVRQLGLWALILIVMGFLLPGISNAAHIGGFVGGFLIGLGMPIRRQPANRGAGWVIAWAVMGVGLIAFLLMINRVIQILNNL